MKGHKNREMQSTAGKKFFYWLSLTLILIGLFSIFTPVHAKDIRANGNESGKRKNLGVFPSAKDVQFLKHEEDKKEDIKDEGLKIVRADTKLELGGLLMWDYDHFSGAHSEDKKEGNHNGSELELRQARIDIKSNFNKNWEAKLQVSFTDSDSSTDIEDAYIKFTGWDYAIVTIGQDKEPFGLEKMTSSKDITFVERSMATNALAPGSHPGLGLSKDTKRYTWAIGVYEAIDRKSKGDTYALTGRMTFAAWQNKNSIFHLGIAGSVRDYGREKYEIEEHAEVHTAKEIVSSGKTLTNRINLLGLEAAWIKGPLSLQAEYMSAFIKSDTVDDATYKGYYLQGSYFFTKESRLYKKGIFEGIKPDNKYGALELVSRYSVLDAEDNNRGVKASNLSLGMNYYINEQIRLMGNYIRTNLSGDVADEDSADALSFRFQYGF